MLYQKEKILNKNNKRGIWFFIYKYLKKCITCLEKTIKESGISKDKIDIVLIVGGSTRIPKIKEMIEEFFIKKDIIIKVINQNEQLDI